LFDKVFPYIVYIFYIIFPLGWANLLLCCLWFGAKVERFTAVGLFVSGWGLMDISARIVRVKHKIMDFQVD